MSSDEVCPPDEFFKIINDFTSDILLTFPEYSGIVSKWWKETCENEEQQKQQTLFAFKHCTKIFPERFFDILYKNADIFVESSEANTEFLPGIVFKQLWLCDISDNTKDTIWKYLQLILFSVIGSVKNSAELGDTAKLFEAINEEELKRKLEETLENMQNMFDASNNDAFVCLDESGNGVNMNPNMPTAEELHQHINSMMGGKLGKLAMELAEETANDLNLDMENDANAKDVFQKLFKNPGKLMKMVKNIGDKIDTKIKSGEIKESELISEGMDLLNKMKSMPGMGNMQQIFSQMGLSGLGGKNTKMNMGAMEAQLNRNMKTAKMKERIRAKAEASAKAREQSSTAFCNMADTQPKISDEELLKIFSTGEKVEKTPRGAKPPNTNSKNGKKKGKK